MNEDKAIDLMRQAIGASMNATIEAIPPRVDTSSGANVVVAAEYRVRVTAPSGMLGPEVLSVLAAANVSLASSDALVV